MTQPDPTPDGYPRDVPPEVLAMADEAVLRMHELLDGAPIALVVSAYRAGKAAGYQIAERQRDLATDQRNDARRLVEEARLEAAALLHMERQHSGHGRDGHLNEGDLAPLLAALQIESEVKP